MRDSTVNVNHGTTSGAMTAGQSVEGRIGRALSFDGTDDFVGGLGNFGQPSTLTISLWFRTTLASWDILFGQTETVPPTIAGAHIPVLTVRGDGMLRAELWTGGVGEILTTFSVRDGFWHNAVVVGNINTQSLFVNGHLIGSRPGMLSQTWWIHSFIGTGLDVPIRGFPIKGWHYFNGVIDEVHVSNIARSPAWIRASFESGQGTLLSVGAEEIR
jgi:hypothetical protein